MHRVILIQRPELLSHEIWISRSGLPGKYEVLTEGGEWIEVENGAAPRGSIKPTLLLPTETLELLAEEIQRSLGDFVGERYLQGRLDSAEDALSVERQRVQQVLERLLKYEASDG
jgi:hypothetical protein